MVMFLLRFSPSPYSKGTEKYTDWSPTGGHPEPSTRFVCVCVCERERERERDQTKYLNMSSIKTCHNFRRNQYPHFTPTHIQDDTDWE